MAKKKPIGPKTRPTGHPPSGARRPPPSARPVSEQTVKAWRVKVVYMQERGRWETLKAGELVEYRPPRKYDGRAAVTIDGEHEEEKAKSSVWQKLVDWCKKKKIGPESYIRYAFQSVPLTYTSAPEPDQLMGDKYLKRWKKGKEKRRNDVRLQLEIQRETARRHITVRQMVYEQPAEKAQIAVIAGGGDLGLSPLFCYCLATSIGTKKMRRIAQRLKAEAVLQFESSRKLYKELWAEFLPEGFARESRELYPYLLAKLWTDRNRDKPSDD